MTCIRPRPKPCARKHRGPLFVFVTSAIIAGLLGHAALLASMNPGPGAEWKAPAPPELIDERGTLSSVNLLVKQH
jgi:hypothetical protein